MAYTKQHKAESCGLKLKSLRRAHNVADGSKITQFMKENEFFFSLSDVMLGIISDSMTHANLIVAIWLENELFITSNICKAFSVLFFIHFDDEKPHYKTMDMSFAAHTSRKNHMNFTSARSHPCGSFSCAFKLALVWCGFHAIIFKLFLPLGDRLISAEQRQRGSTRGIRTWKVPRWTQHARLREERKTAQIENCGENSEHINT